MRKYTQEWVDSQLMGLREPMPHVTAQVPLICRPSAANQSELPEGVMPGLYLKSFAIRGSGSSGIEVEFGDARSSREPHRRPGLLLNPAEAYVYAGFWDTFTSPRRSSCCRIEDGRVAEGVVIPDTFAQLVDAWYTALGRKLDLAIDQVEDKRQLLRETKAALTGTVRG